MITHNPKPLRRRIASALLWTLGLLLLTNVWWSVWSALGIDSPRGYAWDDRMGLMELPSNRSLVLIEDASAMTSTGYGLRLEDAMPSDYADADLNVVPFGDVAPSWLQRLCRAWVLEWDEELEPLGEFRSVGWPVRVLWTGMYTSPINATHHGIRLFNSDEMWPQGYLSIRPIWTGQAFYAAFWLCVVILVRQTRRRFRLWRTHCPNCNYDLRATTTGTCPECGAAITPRAAT